MNQSIKVLILGSCVSRDIFRLMETEECKLASYYGRSSFASAFCPVKVKDTWSGNISSSFQARMVSADLNKKWPDIVRKTEFDVLLVDFIDERFHLGSFSSGALCTLSNELRNSGFDRKVARARGIQTGSDEHYELWERGWTSFIDLLDSLGKKQCVLLNEVRWAQAASDGSVPAWGFTPEQTVAANLYLEKLYSRAAADLESFQVMRADPQNLVSSLNHQWGPAPFHYVDAYYENALNTILEFSDVSRR
ncbi:hypothetical protein JYG33_11860 [Alcaligenes sp. SORT26]|uniref:DUF6270 domain-containing protein n=1 Tax=Alcaligenes sp. SORT26 TaxID=2813780 RepID=UPI001A9CDB11|nr:DUF6270 domain-containing protein [Alcaligenes sp. SORT26]QTB98690.1 hypothetical protein JYG33_11860 [Alcaligenes sp. SORT26]